MYIIINIILVISILALILLGLKFNKKSNEKLEKIGQWLEEFIKKYYKILVMLLLFLTFFTSIFKITTLPFGIHVDEAALAYDSICIAEHGVDRHLRSYPIWLNNAFGSQSSLYAYILVVLIKIFGYSKFILRLPAVMFRMIIFIAMLWVLKDDDSKFPSLLFAFLFAICPYFIMQSRWALDCNILVGCLTLAECVLIKSMKKDSTKMLILSGILFGISLYTYALSFIIIPLILLFTCIYLLYIKKLNFKKLVIFGIPIFLLALPLMLMLLINNGFIEEISGIITIPKLIGYRGSDITFTDIFKNLYIVISILSYDNRYLFGNILTYNALPEFGTIYYIAIPFFIIGIVYSIRKTIQAIKEKTFDINSIFTFWFFAVLLCQLILKEPNINRANALFTPVLYFAVMGIYTLFKNVKAIIIPVVLIFTINFAFFAQYYFMQYNAKSQEFQMFATNYLHALEFVKELKRENVYLDQLLAHEEYIYVLLDYQIEPYNYNTEYIEAQYQGSEIAYNFIESSKWTNLDKKAVYVTGPDEEILEKFTNEGFSHKQFERYRVFYCEE